MRNIQQHSHIKATHDKRTWPNLSEIATRLGELIVPRLAFPSNKSKLIPSSSYGLEVVVAGWRSGRQE